MMKLLKWNVLIKNNSGKFFKPLTTCSMLSGIVQVDHDYAEPFWTDDHPILYSFFDARFLSRELRRVGYNAFSRPYFVFVLKQRFAARRAKSWK